MHMKVCSVHPWFDKKQSQVTLQPVHLGVFLPGLLFASQEAYNSVFQLDVSFAGSKPQH